VGRAGRITGLVALACGVVTVATVSLPVLQFAYRSAAAHLIVATAATVVLLLAAFLSFGRLRRSRRLDDLLLAFGLSWLALSDAALTLLPAFNSPEVRVFLDWDGRASRICGAALIVASCLVRRRRLLRPQLTSRLAFAVVLVPAASTALALWPLRSELPRVVLVAIVRPNWPDLDAPAPVLVITAVTAAMFAVAAVGFTGRTARSGDEFFGWLGIAWMLAAFANFNYLLYPSRSSDWLYTGDCFMLVSCVVLLVGAMREIRSYWSSVSQLRVLEERHRIARDLHDGLAQDVAYISRNLRALESADVEPPRDRIERLRHVAQHAEIESRRALAALRAPHDEPLELALVRAVTDVADRFGTELELDIASGATVSPGCSESLLRIACEAVANAARHRGQPHVSISLDRTGAGLRLCVRDAGRGFDSAAPTSGFGLVSMRERARAVGAELTVKSAPGCGTVVEVSL
jgi:signal transduction histidine kinase